MINHKIKVLVFTDCYIYGGSERLMSFLINNKNLQNKFDLKLSYRAYKDYERGMSRDYQDLPKSLILPQQLLSNESLFYKINCLKLSKIIKLPFFFIQKIQVYSIWNLMVFYFLLKKERPDILHINNGGYPGAKSCNMLVLANKLFCNAKVIYQVNNQATISKKIDLPTDQFICRNVDVFLTASNLAKQMLIKNRQFPNDKIKIINNCIIPGLKEKNREEICHELSLPIESFIIVQVGFLTERKGQRMLILAMDLLLKIHPELETKISALFIGNGEDEIKLTQLVNELGLEKNITFLGYKSNSHDYINACDLFVLPSISNEDMPLVLLTALELGKPIIASNFAGISQVITSEVNGMLIDINDVSFHQELYEIIYKLYMNLALRTLLGNNARKSFIEYSPEKYGQNIENLYRQL
ncbi:glycosyltransferase [Pedobacter heparinus]|uniref:Glycosyl transferase group 1 n=1 Tax=Pedobacter heparinus (strain ATCC 13125 / DSM 2366 / CIP 104194 / JCM 7457 / NBRC 12017 / NCIMB 9290 / NRRL B-14731 / HIM 762-3) TaxID=485917 RepID=C6XVP6_PEDHD|nr:glycosyltransferase [Pedobacter heparinus]ACU06121.1 glycosyl transferase group 1 [Pedobacter heparinus DSM 2366]